MLEKRKVKDKVFLWEDAFDSFLGNALFFSQTENRATIIKMQAEKGPK